MRATATSEDQLSLLGHPDAATGGTVDPGRHMQEPPTQEPSKRMKTRRPRGTGAVLQKGDRWYGQWYIRGRLVKRSLGPVRQPGSRDGLTKSQAEVRLRELMIETNSAPAPVAERLTVGQVGNGRECQSVPQDARRPEASRSLLAQPRAPGYCRVRLNFVRGKTGTPKSKRSSRSVPLADALGCG